MKFYIYEQVPQYVAFRKVVEADTLAEAEEMRMEYAELDAPEEGPFLDGGVIENLPITYEIQEVKE